MDAVLTSQQDLVPVHEAAGPVSTLAHDFRDERTAFGSSEGGWLHELAASGGERSLPGGFAFAAALRFDCEGRLVATATGEHAVMRVPQQGSPERLSDAFEQKPYEDLRGLAVHSSGMMYFSAARLYLLNGESKSVVLASEAVLEPGVLSFSADEKYLFIAQPSKQRIMRMTVLPSGKLEYRCMFAELDEECRGRINDLAVDAAGHIYCATTQGIHVFDRGGQCLGVLLPGEPCAAVCFAGRDHKTLLVASEGRIASLRLAAAGMRPTV